LLLYQKRSETFLSHPLEDSSVASLRVAPTTPDRTEALAGGDTDGKVLRRGTRARRLGSRCSSSAEDAPVACGSRSPELLGRIWHTLALFFLAVQHRWQVLRHGRRQGLGISYNKASFLFLLRFPMLMLLRGISRRPALFSVDLPWWWTSGYGSVGEASSNKRLLLRAGVCVLLLLSSASGHGGSEGGWSQVYSCWIGEDWGDLLDFKLIQARGAPASAIYCRYGGDIATSIKEAFFSSAAEARRRLATKWSRPRLLGDGRWQEMYAGRERTSYSLSFLGGDTWRTPAFRGGGTQVLDCFSPIRCRVFFVKCKPLQILGS
jgi:hypothetical protein